MIPGMNPRQMQAAMKKMGIKQEEIDATQVLIKTSDKTLVINNPSVQKVNMMGQESFQISGQVEEHEEQVEISNEDVQTVMEQTGASEEQARAAIEEHEGNIAQAILSLSSEE